MSDLNRRILAAHAADDRRRLVDLYVQAADQADSPDAAGFFLVHAYVYGLETAHHDTAEIHARLKSEGREE